MTISELIKVLTEAQHEHGDLQVRLQTDHGQVLMKANGYGVSYIDEDNWMPETIDEEEIDEYDSVVKVYEIQAF